MVLPSTRPLKVTVRLVVWDKDEESGQTSPLATRHQGTGSLLRRHPPDDRTGYLHHQRHRARDRLSDAPLSRVSSFSTGRRFRQYLPLVRSFPIAVVGSNSKPIQQGQPVRAHRPQAESSVGTCFIRALGCIDKDINNNESILRKFQEAEYLKFEDNKLLVRHYEAVIGAKVLEDIQNEAGEVVIPAGRKVTRSTFRALKKADIEWFPIQPETAPKMTLVADVVNEETGEILCEANTAVETELLERFFQEGVGHIEVFFPDTDPCGELMSNTLINDSVRSPEEALVEIYRKMRPGDPPTVDSSRKLFTQMFFDPQRYDFSRVGRLKFCTKLKLEEDLTRRILSPEDFYATIGYLLKLHRNIGQVDDIDHLGNRRVRSVGELLENQLRVGLVRMQRAIKEKMSLYNDLNTIMPHELINAKPVMASVKEFFGSSQLSQFMDQTNPLSEITHKRRLSALGPGGLSRERAGFEVRDVHTSHYGRICPIETPEGPNIGLISSLSCFARINEFGFIESPYYRVEDGRVIREVRIINPGGSDYKKDDIVTQEEFEATVKRLEEEGLELCTADPYAHYLSAWEEDNYVIAQANAPMNADGSIAQDQVNSRWSGEFKLFPRDTINYIDVSPKQVVSVAASLIPFLENDDANRALMGSNMQRQAVPLLKTAAPTVGTGMEYIAARDSGATVVCRNSGWVETVDAEHIVIRLEGSSDDISETPDFGVDLYQLSKFKRSNQNTCFNQKPIVRKGDYVHKNQVIADGACTEQGELALGKNILVAFMPWRGYNFEDAILISQRVVKEDVYTSIHIEEFEIEARDTKLGPEEITRDIPNLSEEFLKDLDDAGIIRIGATIKPTSIMVGKVTPKGETQLTPEEKLLRAIFGEKAGDVRDASLYAPPGIRGTVVDVKIFSRKGVEKDSRSIQIEEEQTLKLRRSLEDQEQIIQNQAIKNILKLLKDQEVLDDVIHPVTGETLVAADAKIDPDKLSGLRLADLKRIDVADPNIQLEIANISAKTNQQVEVARQVFEEEVEKLKRGDELPPGVIKLVKVYVAVKRKLQVGDKMAGRHGNKGVVSLILPEEDMPYLPDGSPVDVVLNPLGVPSRMNVGQILETHLGMAGRKLVRWFATPVFDGAREADIKRLLEEAGCDPSGKTQLFDGRTGEAFEQPVTVGVIYIIKLHHLVDNKIHSRSIGPYSLITQQPLGGKAQFGGQRFGEMEVWALEAYGAAHILQELLTVKSDDVQGRTRVYEAIVKGEPACEPGIPESFNVLVKELQSLALDVKLFKKGDLENMAAEAENEEQ